MWCPCQDTDITPTGLGAYASRQTYMEGFAIDQTGRLLREKILAYAAEMLGCSAEEPGHRGGQDRPQGRRRGGDGPVPSGHDRPV